MVIQNELSAQEYLLRRLRSFMPKPNREGLAGYFGVGYPLYSRLGKQWGGIKDMGFPILVTNDRILTECYVATVFPDGNETVVIDALRTGQWEIPDDLHIRVWTPQPKKKGELPTHAKPEHVQAFQEAGIQTLEFMNTVKTSENSVRIPDLKVPVSQVFFDEWMTATRSGEPYLCFLPEKKTDRMVAGLRWFVSELGISFNGGNRKFGEDMLQARGCTGSPEAIWLWRLCETARAGLAMKKSGVTDAIVSASLNLPSLRYGLQGAAKDVKQKGKAQGKWIETVGGNLTLLVENGEYSMALKAADAMRDDAEFAGWVSAMQEVGKQVDLNGSNVNF
jgi:hypothetical protein